MGEGVEILRRGVYVAQKPLVRAVEVAGINIAVALDNKLVHTMSAYTALLRGITPI